MSRRNIFDEIQKENLRQARLSLLSIINPMESKLNPLLEESKKIADLVEEIEHLLGY